MVFVRSVLFVLALAALAGPARADNVDIGLHSSRAAIAPGERFTIAFRETIRQGWHTYWLNPGDSGEPTELSWRPAPGFTIGEIQWPAPTAIPFAMLVNYGYAGEVLFPIEVTAPANARVGSTVTLTADAFWLVCSDVCIPEEGTVSLTLPVEAQGRDDLEWNARIAEAVANLPRRDSAVQAAISAGSPARLSVGLPEAQAIRNPRFFAFDRDAVQASAPQRPRVGSGGVSFSLTPGVDGNLGEGALSGVITYEAHDGRAWTQRALDIAAEPGAVIAATDAQPAVISADYALAALEGKQAAAGGPNMGAAVALLVALALAFIGGLILNVMPCVLPVLSVKALALAGGAHSGSARRHGVLYLAGVMVTFLGLAAVLVALRSAGAGAGWGVQLQEPWVTGALALLFYAIGLNLLGVFWVGAGVQDTGAGLAARGGDVGAFFTGALAVVAATPCTAPFMAGAIGAALTQSNASALLVFAALGFGFALPLTALHFAPGLQRLLPKPGVWMERSKQVLAFPMFAAAVWLSWVLTTQTGPSGALALLALAVALGFALFVARWGRAWMAAGALALLTTTAFAWRPLAGVEMQDALAAEPWSETRVAELRAEGRGVFVNFTAAWCVTCKVNEAAALSQPRVLEALRANNVAYLVGDWTSRDASIAAVLAEHGRAGVPLYLYYAPGEDAVVLPQLLSQQSVIDAIARER
ncbi:MAG: protein-disulfide reductase DsbD family protein [Hyphomonadaceae bacterium]